MTRIHTFNIRFSASIWYKQATHRALKNSRVESHLEIYLNDIDCQVFKKIIVHSLQLCSDGLERPGRSLIGRRAIIVRFRRCSRVLGATKFNPLALEVDI